MAKVVGTEEWRNGRESQCLWRNLIGWARECSTPSHTHELIRLQFSTEIILLKDLATTQLPKIRKAGRSPPFDFVP